MEALLQQEFLKLSKDEDYNIIIHLDDPDQLEFWFDLIRKFSLNAYPSCYWDIYLKEGREKDAHPKGICVHAMPYTDISDREYFSHRGKKIILISNAKTRFDSLIGVKKIKLVPIKPGDVYFLGFKKP